jgi:hypothetical protein
MTRPHGGSREPEINSGTTPEDETRVLTCRNCLHFKRGMGEFGKCWRHIMVVREDYRCDEFQDRLANRAELETNK